MPRAKRIVPDNAALHVISRGNNQSTVFHSDNDKLRYYTLLQELKDENKIDIFHYCLMNTHVQIIRESIYFRVIIVMPIVSRMN